MRTRKRILFFLLLGCMTSSMCQRGLEAGEPSAEGGGHFGYGVVQAGGKLVLSIRTDCQRYLYWEPIRIVAQLRNEGSDDFTISHKPGENAATMKYYWARRDEEWQELSTSRIAQFYMSCIPGTRAPERLFWTVRGGDYFIPLPRFWTENHFDVGVVRFKAEFQTLPRGKQQQVVSNEVSVRIVAPEGRNLEALRLWESPKLVPIGDTHYSLGEIPEGFIHNSGSHHGRPVHEYFLRQSGDSRYSWYVRWTMLTYVNSNGAEEDFYDSLLESIVRSAPRDFPLLVDCYVELLGRYKGLNYLERMFSLAQKATKEHFSSADPEVRKELDRLIQDIAWWPPKTNEQQKVAHEAALQVQVREMARKHPLTQAMTTAYGSPRQPGSCRNTLVGPDFRFTYPGKTWGFGFYDPRQSWPLNLKFISGTKGNLERVEFSGGLESFCVGYLKKALEDIKREFGADSEDALKIFVQAHIEDNMLSGQLQFPDKRRSDFKRQLGDAK